MNTFIQNQWKNIFFIFAIFVISFFVWNINYIFNRLKNDERIKIELFASAQQELISGDNTFKQLGNLPFEVLQKTGKNPVILVDRKNRIIDYKNIDWWDEKNNPDSTKLYDYLEKLKTQNKPIEVTFQGNLRQKVYYANSDFLNLLQYFPLIFISVIFFFSGLLYFFIYTNRTSEQNKLWVGMAKESAHQIGTPLTALFGWIEILKSEQVSPSILLEMQKDLKRLELISNRFSSIGSLPYFQNENITEITLLNLTYLKKRRGTKKIEWKWNIPTREVYVPLNTLLFSWTLENIINNAIDAMKGEGKVNINFVDEESTVSILISDTGGGIDPKNTKKIFSPGFSTKKTGWGLGLSLAKRIIEDYHKGKLFVKKSSINIGTTFEVQLRK